MRELFPGAPPSRPVAGDPNEIKHIGRPAAFSYFQAHYRPENIAIAIVGNVNPEEIRRLCTRYFADWRPAGEPGGDRSPRKSRASLASPVIKSFKSSSGPIVYFAFPRVVPTPAEEAALEAIAEMINSEELSPLVQQLIQKQAIAWSVGAAANYPSQKETSLFLVHVYGRTGTRDDGLVQMTSALLKSLSASAKEDLEGAILASEIRLAAQMDDPPSLAALLGFHEAVQGDWSLPFQQLEGLRELNVEQVRSSAHRLFDGLSLPTQAAAGRAQ